MNYTKEQISAAHELLPTLWIKKYNIKNEAGLPIEFDNHFFLWDIYNDLTPIQAILKAPQIGMTVLEVIKSLYVAKKLGRDIIYCVDTETEALTLRGFLSYKDLTLEDYLLTLSLNGSAHWSKVEEVFVNDVETTMYEYDARNFNAFVTENHRWIVHNEKGEYSITTSDKLTKQNLFIPKTVVESDFSNLYPTGGFMTNDYVRLLAWVFSEGHYPKQAKGSGKNCYSIIITQSHQKNPQKCDEIRRVLKSVVGKWKENVTYRGDCTNFRFAFEIGEKIRRWFPDKIPDMDLARSLTRNQAKIFIETFVAGDGWIDKGGTLAITQKNKQCIDVLAVIAVLAGYAPSIVKPSKSGCYTLRLTQFPVVYTQELKPKIHKNWKGKVWCPRTKEGTFYARRRGRMYWTGNTLPTASDVNDMAGGKVNRIIAQNPILMEWVKDHDTVDQKTVGDNIIYYRGTWISKAAMMVSSQLNIHDEVDASKQDVVMQYETRLQATTDGWRWYFSHPSSPETGVDKVWQLSDQKHWFIKCPHCSKKQFLAWPDSVDIERKEYVCKYCQGVLSDESRRRGEWIKRFKDRQISGYWISQLMCPWIPASKIVHDFLTKPEEYFYNYVLGLPYAGKGNKVTLATIEKNLTNTINTQDGRIIIGCDTGLDLHYVIGNKQGLFFNGKTKTYDDLEVLLNRWPTSIIVFDGQGDLIAPRRLAEKYTGRIFFCFYNADRKNTEIVQWGTKNERMTARADRNRLIQWLVDEFNDGKIPLQGKIDDWYDYYLHWSHIHRVTEEDNLGVVKSRWERSGADHWCFVAGTRIITDQGEKKIEDIEIGDKVLTRGGFKKVYKSGISGENAKVVEATFSDLHSLIATPNHKVWVKGKGFIALDAMSYGDIIERCEENKLFIKESLLGVTRIPLVGPKESILSQMVLTAKKELGACMRKYGKPTTERFHWGLLFIIKIITRLITNLETWLLYHEGTIRHSTILTGSSVIKRGLTLTLLPSDLFLTRGGEQNQAENGTATTPKGLWYWPSQWFLFVLNVVKNLLLKVDKVASSVGGSVHLVGMRGIGGEHTVYNLSVEDEHEYYAHGVLVSNCHASAYWRVGVAKFGDGQAIIPTGSLSFARGPEIIGGKIYPIEEPQVEELAHDWRNS